MTVDSGDKKSTIIPASSLWALDSRPLSLSPDPCLLAAESGIKIKSKMKSKMKKAARGHSPFPIPHSLMAVQLDSDPSPLPFAVRRFSVQEYHRLAEVGVLSEEDRVELLEGVISPKRVHSPLHDATVSVIEALLRPLLNSGWILRIQSSVTLAASEPEPDLAVALGPPQRYRQHHPSGNDLGLVIEVAESSLRRDRAKAATYAAGGIPCYWIVNLTQQQLEIFHSPQAGSYQHQQILQADQMVELGGSFSPATRPRVAEFFANG